MVAVEPLPFCNELKKIKNSKLYLEQKACGARSEKRSLKFSGSSDVLATLSKRFIFQEGKKGKNKDKHWNLSVDVEVVTLDDLINKYGLPKFIKIDVEGFEKEVLKGLSHRPKMLSFEYSPEMTDQVLDCLQECRRLSFTLFNTSFLESMALSFDKWRDENKIFILVNALKDDTFLFGDIYAK